MLIRCLLHQVYQYFKYKKAAQPLRDHTAFLVLPNNPLAKASGLSLHICRLRAHTYACTNISHTYKALKQYDERV